MNDTAQKTVFQASGLDVENARGPNVTICVLGCRQPNRPENDLRHRQSAHKVYRGRWVPGLGDTCKL